MKNRGQLFPVGKWIAGVILLAILIISYEFFSPIIDTTLPDAMSQSTGNNPYVQEINNAVSGNFTLAILILGFGYLLYLFLAGLPGQQEEYPI